MRSRESDIRAHVRWAIRADLPHMVRIEEQCYEFPWSHSEFVNCLRNRYTIGLVAEIEERVAGFLIYEITKRSLHIMNIAVDEQMRRRGVATQIIEHKIAHLKPGRRTAITTEVRESNLVAQVFFRSVGFKAVRVLRDWYDESDEDAYRFEYVLPHDETVCRGK